MSKPSSFCTLCTKPCKHELLGFLLSLSLYHPNEKVYVMCDTATKKYIKNSTPQPKLDINWHVTLDKYTYMDRKQMEQMGIWSDFQMSKGDIIELALNTEPDTLFIDNDTIILDTINDIDKTKQLGVSPQFLKKTEADKWGYYNGGMIWTNQKNMPQKWREFTKTSRYFDQASIEDLAKFYSFFEFGDNYNLQSWRFIQGEEAKKVPSYLKVNNNKIFYKKKPLKFIHTHFKITKSAMAIKDVNQLFINLMCKAKLYKQLSIIYRVINDKWVFCLPKQPIQGKYQHNNDSFREIPILLRSKNKDVDLIYSTNTNHCWLTPNILLYDRPTLMWFDDSCLQASLLLMGNGSNKEEGQFFKSKNLIYSPWIFWPRRPMIVEKIIKEKPILNFSQRNIKSLFIGNFENAVQAKYRNNHNWESVLQEYHCTKGSKHKFTQVQYLDKLRNSKYGLCLRGFGSKCHREVELMAFGTIPIVTSQVSIDFYYDPPKENVHYLRVNSPEEFKQKISSIDEKTWSTMSKNCHDWYMRNVHSSNAWNQMIEKILYS